MNVVGKSCQTLLRVGTKKSLLWCSVRYARKPRWVPIAKSKMYKIRELPYQPVHEEDEILRLKEHYQLYNRSLWEFQRQINEDHMIITQSATKEISEEGELDRIIAETERDNAIVRSIREKQVAEEWKQIEAEIIAEKAKLEEEKLQELLATEEKLKAQMEKMKKMITNENLDEAVEKALAMEVDYNFAIDKEGNIYKGRLNIDRAEEISSVDNFDSIQARTPVGK